MKIFKQVGILIALITFTVQPINAKTDRRKLMLLSVKDNRCLLMMPIDEILKRTNLAEFVEYDVKNIYHNCKSDYLKIISSDKLEKLEKDNLKQLEIKFFQFSQMHPDILSFALHNKYTIYLKKLKYKSFIFQEDLLMPLSSLTKYFLKETKQNDPMYQVYKNRLFYYHKAHALNKQVFHIWQHYSKTEKATDSHSSIHNRTGDVFFSSLHATDDICIKLATKYHNLQNLVNENQEINFSNINSSLSYVGMIDSYLNYCHAEQSDSYKKFKKKIVAFTNANISKIENNLLDKLLLGRNSYYLNGKATYALLTYYYELKVIHDYVKDHSVLIEKLYGLSKEIYDFYMQYAMEK